MSVNGRDEGGFTMIMTVIGITLIILLTAVAVTAVTGSAQVTGRDVERKQAYEAAIAGINEYAFHLNRETAYWTKCTEAVPKSEASALNQKGSTANRRPIPGGSGATYALELIPANGYSECVPNNNASMLVNVGQSGSNTFQLRSNGYYGTSHVAVMATFKPGSFLDYVYFTQLETSDPVTYGTPELREAAGRQCNKTIEEHRYESPLKTTSGQMLTESGAITTDPEKAEYCDVISFVGADNIEGPMHTNDAFVFCERPTLGRDKNDAIEVSAATAPGWYETRALLHTAREKEQGCSGNNTNVKGTYKINQPAFIPPPTNSELATIAEPHYHYEGEVSICLKETTMAVGEGTSCTEKPLWSGAFPANGVIYDGNRNNECNTEYSPFNVNYETSATVNPCGNVNIVEGKYAKPLTIAAANNVLIKHSIEKTTEEGMLGLIATNFIRVYHPVVLAHPKECTPEYNSRGQKIGEKCVEKTNEWECKGNNGEPLKNLTVEAALLALQHSFIVDNYRCGSKLGTLTVKGAIAQKYRGAVGTTGSNGNGYLKHYVYDNRLRNSEPPSFIEPVKSDWVIGRETVE